MKRYITLALMLPALLLLVTSCLKDKGNYDYKNIDEAVIDIPTIAPADTLVRYWRTDLELNPVITTTTGQQASTADYDFEWFLIPTSLGTDDEGNAAQTRSIGSAADIDYFLADAPGMYYVALKATHKTTEAVTYYRFALNIQSTNGWMIYDETGGQGDIHMISDPQVVPGLDEGMTNISRNLYSAANEGAKMAGGTFISVLDVTMTQRYHTIYVFKANGVYKINAGTFELITDNYNDLFISAPTVAAPMAHYYFNGTNGMKEFLINNNEVHVLGWSGLGITDVFPAALNGYGTAYKLGTTIAPIYYRGDNGFDNSAVFFQPMATTGRFVTLPGGNNILGYPEITTGSPAFNPAMVNPDFATSSIALQHMGTGFNGKTLAVIDQTVTATSAVTRWLYVGNFTKAETPEAIMKKDMNAVTGFADATHYAFGQRGDIIFYADDNAVYSYAYAGAGEPRVAITLAGGEEVTSMKLYTHSKNADYNGRILFVATYDGAQGKIYKVQFNELNGEIGTIETYDGFGRVIDMYSKE